MTTRAMNWYISARTGLVLGGSVQVCPATDAAAAEVRAALEADGVPVRVEGEMLWAGEGPVATEEPEPVLTPAELRAERYRAEVDPLVAVWGSYLAEGAADKAAAVQAQIVALKARIRAEIPDA